MKKLILLYHQIKGENNMSKKLAKEIINIAPSTSEILITYALIYSNLTVEGKKEAQKQLKLIGENFDLMQEKLKGGK